MGERDLVFEALYECWTGRPYDQEQARALTSTQRGRINRAAQELRKVGATPDEVRVRWERLRATWPGLTITPQALCAHWATIPEPPTRVSKADEWLARRNA